MADRPTLRRGCAMKLATARQVRDIDRLAQDRFGIPAAGLMERAGVSGWNAIVNHFSSPCSRPASFPVAFVVGKGHNGGDALVMARCAAEAGYSVAVVLAAAPDAFGELSRAHLRSAEQIALPIVIAEENLEQAVSTIREAALVIDGLAGSGISGALRHPHDTLATAIANHGPHRVAVDVPSGLGDDWEPAMPAAIADLTLAMGLPQRSLFSPVARERCGKIVQIDVGFPRELTQTDSLMGEVELAPGSDLGTLFPPLLHHLHKHSRGVVAVLAGSRGGSGAALLAAGAAQHSRAGLVHLAVDADIYPSVSAAASTVMVHPLEQWDRSGLAADSVLIGPGWGTGIGRAITLSRLLAECDTGVLDADALNLLAKWPDSFAGSALGERWILTPHVGELARLTGTTTADVKHGFIDLAVSCASRWGCVVVAKSHVVVIAGPDGRYFVVDGGNPALATGGSGDVLAGVLAGLLASGMGGRDAARLGVMVHQRAGRSVRSKSGLFSADMLIPEIARLLDHGGD